MSAAILILQRITSCEGLSNLLKVMELGICRVKIRIQVVWVQSPGRVIRKRLEVEARDHANISWWWRGLLSGRWGKE